MTARMNVGVVALVVAAFVSFLIVMVLPTFLAVFSLWDLFIVWFPIVLWWARWVLCPVGILASILWIVKSRFEAFGPLLYYTFMLGWGFPIYLDLVLRVVVVPLSPLELQRTILQIIIIGGLASLTYASATHGHETF